MQILIITSLPAGQNTGIVINDIDLQVWKGLPDADDRTGAVQAGQIQISLQFPPDQEGKRIPQGQGNGDNAKTCSGFCPAKTRTS